MGARQKLNSAHLGASLIIASMAGIISGSFTVFVIALVAVLAMGLHAGDIRLKPQRHH